MEFEIESPRTRLSPSTPVNVNGEKVGSGSFPARSSPVLSSPVRPSPRRSSPPRSSPASQARPVFSNSFSPASAVVASYLPEPVLGEPATLKEYLGDKGLTPVSSFRVGDDVMVSVQTEKGTPALVSIPNEIYEELTSTEDEVLIPHEARVIEDFEDHLGEHEEDGDDLNIVARSLKEVDSPAVCIPTSSGFCIRSQDRITPIVFDYPASPANEFVGSDIPQPIVDFDSLQQLQEHITELIDSDSVEMTKKKYFDAVEKMRRVKALSRLINDRIHETVCSIDTKLITIDSGYQYAIKMLEQSSHEDEREHFRSVAVDQRHKFGRLLRFVNYLSPLIERYEDLNEKLEIIQNTIDEEMGSSTI